MSECVSGPSGTGLIEREPEHLSSPSCTRKVPTSKELGSVLTVNTCDQTQYTCLNIAAAYLTFEDTLTSKHFSKYFPILSKLTTILDLLRLNSKQ